MFSNCSIYHHGVIGLVLKCLKINRAILLFDLQRLLSASAVLGIFRSVIVDEHLVRLAIAGQGIG